MLYIFPSVFYPLHAWMQSREKVGGVWDRRVGKVTNWAVLAGDSYNLPTKSMFCALLKCELKFNLALDSLG